MSEPKRKYFVGGEGEQYSNNYDRIFGNKPKPVKRAKFSILIAIKEFFNAIFSK
jgi:hypothetical protein